ncbi:MAG: Gfo/Idh/MocA family oxidoreductase [Pseudomonadales bacterium]|nr:Gfo/Idh/MocA family oxidoreductase [Pseudomonadales bacterium]MCP5171111.1 Gfo/Idh/MocA family oxidoreductase [Pseudomonadales bacterium]MCP5301652.1 Gfo/Idh/MocA family oxidoreductase [Pseudomonadales bacterium]
MKKIRYGILSTADIGLSAHIPAARETDNSVVTALASRNLQAARSAADKCGVEKAYGSYQELLDDPDIDVVINPLPISMHLEWTRKTAEAGKHILLEKPVALNTAQAREIKQILSEHNVLFYEAFTHRFNPQLNQAAKWVVEGVIGDVVHISSALTVNFTADEDNIRWKPELGGGGFIDAGCYTVCATRLVMGETPTQVFGAQRTRHDVDATFLGTLMFESGALATVKSSLEHEYICYLNVYGSKGVIRVTHMLNEDAPVLLSTDKGVERFEFDAVNRYAVQLEHFSECVLTGTQPRWGIDDAIENMKVIDALYKSAQSGQVEKVESDNGC